jgi:hypothetical protein
MCFMMGPSVRDANGKCVDLVLAYAGPRRDIPSAAERSRLSTLGPWYAPGVRIRGFAELVFDDSARLIMARVCERAPVDVTLLHPEAWVVDERRISFAIDTDLSEHELAEYEAFLRDLASEARVGELELSVDGQRRVFERLGSFESGSPSRASGPASDGARPTLRVKREA